MRPRSFALSTLGWVFGMAVSILLLALWGRSVVSDTDALAESLTPLAGSGFVMDHVANWMSNEMVQSGADPETVDPTVDHLLRSSTVGGTLDQLVIDVVHAAASDDPQGSIIDMAGLFGPTVPELTVGLTGLGYPVTEDSMRATVDQFDPLVIRPPGTGALVGPDSPAASRLGTAALLAVIVMTLAGTGYASLSEDRLGSLRSLMTRVALGGLSFAIFLRLGSWVLDPRGGRAPVAATLSAVAASKWVAPLWIASIAGVLAVLIYLWRRPLRRGGAILRPDGQATQPRGRSESVSASR